MPRRALLLHAVLLLGGAAGPFACLQAQDTTVAPAGGTYSTVTVALSAARSIADGALGPYWDAGTGARVDVSTRFHVGDVGAFVVTLPYTARSASQPDFRAFVIGVDWRVVAPRTWRVRPSIGITAGDLLTTFEGVETTGLSKESEIFLGGTAGLALRVHGGTQLTATATAIQALTSTPIRTASVSVGLAHEFSTPGWLRGVIE
ncbi:MAG TPA: hypothetical protein VFT96_06330 [Gemmatimonadaceae bacterium]|nr:hypothetical protein [Gemmatimonadaceae bacterium]